MSVVPALTGAVPKVAVQFYGAFVVQYSGQFCGLLIMNKTGSRARHLLSLEHHWNIHFWLWLHRTWACRKCLSWQRLPQSQGVLQSGQSRRRLPQRSSQGMTASRSLKRLCIDPLAEGAGRLKRMRCPYLKLCSGIGSRRGSTCSARRCCPDCHFSTTPS